MYSCWNMQAIGKGIILRIAVVNLTGGGLGGGYRKYLQNILPLMAVDVRKVPSCLKATSTERKILPRKLAGRLLPQEFDLQRKQGFSIPMAVWPKRPEWRRYFRHVLLESEDSLFNRKFVTGRLDGQDRGYSNSERLFALLMFELWRQEYNVSA